MCTHVGSCVECTAIVHGTNMQGDGCQTLENSKHLEILELVDILVTCFGRRRRAAHTMYNVYNFLFQPL